ncbi:MAG: glycosyltransferase [Rhodobacteraceae bacterium]|nr:glycosyltransferase [Paracoccaceae bacterium]
MNSVSVLIPCYNAHKYIEEAIASILLQKEHVGEILIYDDASHVETTDVLKQIERSEPLVKVHYATKNSGAGIARAFLISNAKYPFCAFLDADDVWLPNKLEIQLKAFSMPDVLVCFSSYFICDSDLKPNFLKTATPRVKRRALLFANRIPTSAALFRTDSAQSVAFPELRRRQDYAFWLKLFHKYPSAVAVGLQEPLMKYRKHAGSLSSSRWQNLRYNYQVFRSELGFNPITSMFFVGANIFNRFLNNKVTKLDR